MADREKVDGFGASDKPRKKKRLSGVRFSFHNCYHGDAWQGLLLMPPDEVGVYWRIILLMYIRKAAITDNDVEMAQLCHTSTRSYRRIKASLVARGRIIVDDDHGILYDERTIKELVAAGFFSEVQTARSMKRHTATPPRVIVDNDARCDPLRDENVIPLTTDIHQLLGRSSARSSAEKSVDIAPPPEAIQAPSVQSVHANHYPLTKEQANRPPERKRAAQPPRGGGALSHQEWLKHQAAELGLTEAGKDEGLEIGQSRLGDDEALMRNHVPADRTVRRS